MSEKVSKKNFICVVDRDHHILYINDQLQNYFYNNKQDKVNENDDHCMETACIHGIVEDIKKKTIRDDEKLQIIKYDKEFKMLMNFTVLSIKWEKEENALMIIFSREEIVSKHLSENKYLENVYDGLFELNITQNHYTSFFHKGNKFIDFTNEGILDTTILKISEMMILPEDQGRFSNFFDLHHIREKLTEDKVTSAEFRKKWIHHQVGWISIILIYLQDDNETEEKYLCFVKNIDKKRMLEIQSKKEKMLIH